MKTSSWINIRSLFGLLLVLSQLCWLGQATAQAPPAGPTVATQFDITGFLQEATLDGVGAGALQGGHLKVNGHVVTVPSNTIVILPANALTWQELFAQAPAPYTGVATGMALADIPAPLTTYEVHVVGNRVGDQYIAGLVNISQQDLNSGAGYINFIDYSLGEMRVGGTIVRDATGVPVNTLDAANPGARVRINDPVGRYGRIITPDQRFTVDPDNPTIMSATGYPMCLPRTDPAVADDPLCPQGNRPKDVTGNFVPAITTANLTNTFGGTVVCGPTSTNNLCPPPGTFPDSTKQAPFEVGDYVTFAGTLVTDTTATPTQGPYPGTPVTYISAHTIVNNIGIWTFQGSDPAYIMTEVTLIGTGGLTVIGAGEAVVRTRFEGMMTDPSRSVHLYGIDIDPNTGITSDRDWGTIGVDPGPPNGAVKGRWRFRPPCAVFGTDPNTIKFDKQCIMNAAGTFLPPTREMRAVIEGQQSQVAALNAGDLTKTAANGLFYGQYHAPILEYIFPENVPGTPIPPNNFETIPFMACGGYTSSAGTRVGQLTPWPGAVAPICAGATSAPVVNIGGPFTVASGGTLNLTATVSGNPAPTLAWTATGGSFSSTNTASTVFTAPTGPATVTLTLTATNSAGTASANATVTVNAPAAPTASVAVTPATTVTSGTPVTLTNSCDLGGCTFVTTQTGGTPTVLTAPVAGSTVSFTPTLPVGTLTASTLTFQVVATKAGVSSAPVTVQVTVNPQADVVTITIAEYRTGKQRLDLTVTSNIVSPNLVMKLQPYLTTSGTTFDPALLGNTLTNGGGGIYTLTLVGAPEPAVPPATPLTVKSSLGGQSPPTALTRIRQ